MNAGHIPTSTGCSRTPAEGGRVLGELCHFVDWARCVVDCDIVSVAANALPDGARYNRDNVVATLRFQDGSIASVAYLANGDSSVAKEELRSVLRGQGRAHSAIFALWSWLATERPTGPRPAATKDMNGRSH